MSGPRSMSMKSLTPAGVALTLGALALRGLLAIAVPVGLFTFAALAF